MEVFALKGLRITAQGNALGWECSQNNTRPERAKHHKLQGDSITKTKEINRVSIILALTGRLFSREISLPRALPWAVMCRPYRPGFKTHPFYKFQQYDDESCKNRG
jgi:hypothetical protein